MVLCNLLVLLLTFNELVIDLDALTCPKGQRVRDVPGWKSCETCPDGSYWPTENTSQKCKGCTQCLEGSYAKVLCSKERDAECQCREGFVPRFKNSAMCKCQPGFGLTNGACSKCKEGYFSTKDNSPCQKWNDCPATGVKKPGNSTSDAICNKESSSIQQRTTPSTSMRKTAPTHITSPRPHEGNQTPKPDSPTTTTSPPPQKVPPASHSSNYIGLVLLCLGVAGLLVWTAITCKMHVPPCCQKKTMQTKDSLCRRPVEESGDSSETSVKLNLEP
ncbi:tumor necrosis factor receptor superfamily member 4 [Kryptolebias marmoratus]|uniref:Tumor necrosis factor receptor superfamily member 4-like n=1 Tax=Kryptolebias marmoratus TaxID=37003 RepID=A0A3Q2ZWD0_KRYMA|nr:tumor necrosis factor receptor superfamily member 4 [Kryptolebias marmoratus]